MSTTDANEGPSLTAQQEMFTATIRRFNRETEKFIAEHDKLAAEAKKFERERLLAPWQIAIVLVGAIGGFVGGAAGLAAFWHAIAR